MIEQNFHHQMEQISIAGKYGVRIGLGTDSGSLGVFHGKAVAEELNLLIQGGLTLPEAVSCATKNGAELLGLKNKGVIARGMPADFLVFRCSPDQLPDNLTSLREIYLGGAPWQQNTVLP